MPFVTSCAALCLLSGLQAPAVDPVVVDQPDRLDEIVVLGRREAPRDATLGAGAVTERMSPSSRAIENDLIEAVGARRLADALELVSGVSQQNNRGGVMERLKDAIKGTGDSRPAAACRVQAAAKFRIARRGECRADCRGEPG